MNGLEFIKSKQQNWASRKGFKLVGGTIPDKGEENYLPDLTDNLFEPLSEESLDCYNSGDGNETKDSKTRLAKMKALHSSSAIVVNLFQYWREKDAYPIVYACKLCSKHPSGVSLMIENVGSKNPKIFSDVRNVATTKIKFEEKFEISNVFPHSPNIDVVIEGLHPLVYAIESKFTEPYNSGKQKGIDQKYIDNTGSTHLISD